MNGIEKISARILADAETEAAAIRAQAEEKAAQIRTDYDRRIESEQQRLTAEAQAEAEKQLARNQGAARMAARRQLLETKQALVDAAFRQAEQQLLSLPTAEYTKLCAQLAARASASGSEELIFCTEDRERVGQAVVEQANALLQKAGKAAKLTLSAETRPMRGGVKACKDTEYLFISAYLRAKEPQLLNAEKAGRMLGSSVQEAARILESCGYADVLAVGLDKALSDRRAAVFSEVEALAPKDGVVALFRMRYDYHNAKTIVKAEAVGIDPAPLLSGAGRADPQLADLILDRAYFAEYHETAAQVGSAFLMGYAQLQADSANLRAAVRARRMHKDAAFLKSVLVPGGSVPAEEICQVLAQDEPFAPLFANTALFAAAQAGDESQSGSLTAFERLCDNTLTAYFAKAKSVVFGEQVVIAYLCALENEISAARMIISGLQAGLPADTIRARLRDLYQ